LSNLLNVSALNIKIKSEQSDLHIIRDLDINLRPGESLGIVGESGCGKTVLGLSLLRLLFGPLYLSSGSVVFNNKNIYDLPEPQMRNIRGKDIAMVFQEPMVSLNPIYTIGAQLSETLLSHLSLEPKPLQERCLELLSLVKILDPDNCLKQYPHQLSGGMLQRVMIAMAIAHKPKLLIADEPTTALDVTTQFHILSLLKQLQEQSQMAMIFITHDLGVVAQSCKKLVVMYAGKIVEQGLTLDVLQNPAHPYTKGLLASIPKVGNKGKRLITIPGNVPSFSSLPVGCNFAERCLRKIDKCLQISPELVVHEQGRRVSCFNPLLKDKPKDQDARS
jgi:peptide/nickel transport system ATP-binding protein